MSVGQVPTPQEEVNGSMVAGPRSANRTVLSGTPEHREGKQGLRKDFPLPPSLGIRAWETLIIRVDLNDKSPQRRAL